MQLLPAVFDELTPAAYYRMAAGYFRRLDDQEQPLRKLAWVIASINRGPDHPGYEPADMWPMRSDPPPPPPPPPPTPEETAALLAALDDLDKDLL